jgi:hypothetical protein
LFGKPCAIAVEANANRKTARSFCISPPVIVA